MKTIAKVVLKMMLLLCIIVVLWIGLTDFLRIEIDESGNQFRNLPDNSIDILVLGSSHAQYSMNPAVIHNESGYYSYVLGSGCQPMSMSYKFLEEALKTQSPEVVVLDVFTMMPAQEVCYADGMFYRAIQQMSGLTRFEAAALVDNNDVKYDYMFDLRINHGNWRVDDFYGANKKTKEINLTFGYIPKNPTDFRFLHLVPFEKNDEYTLRQKDIDMLNSIIETCNENKIKLILMKAPITIDQKNQNALETIWEYAKSKNIDYIDYLALAEEIEFTLGMDGDTWHNNTWGAEKISKYMAQYIMANQYIKNHKHNEYLNDLYLQAENETMKRLSMNRIDIYNLLELASRYDCMVAFKYKGYSKSSIGIYENEILRNIGLDHDFVKNKNKDYYALLHNGKIIVESDEPIKKEYKGMKYEISDEKILLGNEEFRNLGELEIVVFGEDLDWFQDIDVDYASRFFWKNGYIGWDKIVD